MPNDGYTDKLLRGDELEWIQQLLDEAYASPGIGGERDAGEAWDFTLSELIDEGDFTLAEILDEEGANLDGHRPPEFAYDESAEDSPAFLAELLPDHEVDDSVERWFQRLRIPLDPGIEKNFIADVLFAANALTAAGLQLTSSNLERLLMALEAHRLCSPPPLLEDLEQIQATHHEALESAATPEELAALVSAAYSDSSATLRASKPADQTTPETSGTHSVPTHRQSLEPEDDSPAWEHQPEGQIRKSPTIGQTESIHERLELLVHLHESGLITESELAKRRWEILREI